MSEVQRAEPAAVTLVIRRTVRASAERLFAAWTDPEQLKRWWGPRSVVCSAAEIDLRPGGRYRLANRFPDGRIVWIYGEFEEIAPPRILVYTWNLDPPKSAGAAAERVTIRFEPRAEATDIIICHERVAPALKDEHEIGWQGCLDGLEALLQPEA
jgi:uncharacterized protein YndB with AHSA1/START domain